MATGLIKRSLAIVRDEGIIVLSGKVMRHCNIEMLFFFFWPRLLYALRSLNKNYSVDYLIQFAYDKKPGVLKPMQVREEITELLRYVSREKINSYLEIGTASGGTLFLISQLAAPEAVLISIDLPGGSFGGGYGWWKIPLYKMFTYAKQKLHLVRADSHSQETVIKIKQLLREKKVDVLFIDGDHTYEGVKKDFMLYSPLVKEGGTIVFHDIAEHSPAAHCEVNKFWNEIKTKYESREIIHDRNQHWAGIGVLTYQL